MLTLPYIETVWTEVQPVHSSSGKWQFRQELSWVYELLSIALWWWICSSANSMKVSWSQRIPLHNRSNSKGRGAMQERVWTYKAQNKDKYSLQEATAFILISPVALSCTDLNMQLPCISVTSQMMKITIPKEELTHRQVVMHACLLELCVYWWTCGHECQYPWVQTLPLSAWVDRYEHCITEAWKRSWLMQKLSHDLWVLAKQFPANS